MRWSASRATRQPGRFANSTGRLGASPNPTPGCRAGHGPGELIAISPDGRTVYVGDGYLGQLAVLKRDLLTGALRQPSGWCVTAGGMNVASAAEPSAKWPRSSSAQMVGSCMREATSPRRNRPSRYFGRPGKRRRRIVPWACAGASTRTPVPGDRMRPPPCSSWRASAGRMEIFSATSRTARG
jgi:hypothetical protein